MNYSLQENEAEFYLAISNNHQILQISKPENFIIFTAIQFL